MRDEQQDWNLIFATETHEFTIIKMSRLKNTGDPNDYCLSVSNRIHVCVKRKCIVDFGIRFVFFFHFNLNFNPSRMKLFA